MCPPAQLQREDLLGNKEIRCLLVHDHVLLRQGLRRLLDDEPDMEVVAEAGNAAEALRRVFEYRPEIVITDAHIFECAADQAEWLILQESPSQQSAVPDDARRRRTCCERLERTRPVAWCGRLPRKNWWRW